MIVWLSTAGGLVALIGFAALAVSVWRASSVGMAWAIGTLVGAVPTGLVLGFFI